MQIDQIVLALPEEEQRKILQKLQKSLGGKKREKIEAGRHEMIAKAGKILALVDGYNMVEMKKTLMLALAAIEGFGKSNKNPGRIQDEQDQD